MSAKFELHALRERSSEDLRLVRARIVQTAGKSSTLAVGIEITKKFGIMKLPSLF